MRVAACVQQLTPPPAPFPAQMEDMSAEYLDMLKQTLDRMGARIEKESLGMGASDAQLAERLKEFKLGFADI